MNCKDCIHYEACESFAESLKFATEKFLNRQFNPKFPYENIECRAFKPKSRFVELPCAVGDTVYMPWVFDGNEGVSILTVTHIIFDSLHAYIKTDLISDCDEYLIAYNNGRFGFAEFGKTVFLTKEEAEKALKEKQQ